MLGNDIVDLDIALLENKASNPRYLNKICTQKEIAAIQSNEQPDMLLWRIWTMKESVYKIVAKQEGFRLFNPKKIATSIVDELEGQVSTPWGDFVTYTSGDEHCICSIALKSFEQPFMSAYKKIAKGKDASVLCRKELIAMFADQQGYKRKELGIQMQGDAPYLYLGEKPIDTTISLSHHGDYIAWAFLLE